MASRKSEASLIGARATRVVAAETPQATLVSPLITAALLIAGLYLGRDIFIPIAIALLLSFVLAPISNFLRRLRMPRAVAVGLTVLTTLGIVATMATLIGVQVADLASDVPRYRATIERKIEGLRNGPVGHMTDYVANIGRAIHSASHQDPEKEKEKEKENAEKAAQSAGVPEKPPEPKPVLVEMQSRPPGAMEVASAVLSPILHPLATAGIVFIVLLFVLMQREDLRDRMIRLAGSSDLHRTTVAMDDAARRLSRYFLMQLALNIGFGIVVGIGLYFIGVPNPVLWAIFSALMRFIPYIGAFLAALLPMALAAAVDPGWNMIIATAILFVVLEPVVGHIFEPMLYGHSTGLSPFAVLVSALFWTWLWGPIGLLLSTPLTVCLVVLGRHVDKLEFLDVLFGNRPALTPVENFYQRILADDPEEAQEHADLILRECSLPTYYDEVVLKGLELAARDGARGVLTVEQKNAIRASVTELIEELEGRPEEPAEPAEGGWRLRRAPEDADTRDVLPPEIEVAPNWKSEGAVLCVAGRGFLDEAAAAILAQLLAKRGIGTRTVSFSEVARSQIDQFQPGSVQMICIISLAIGGEPSHLRRLVHRLKTRMPRIPILIGLWQADDGTAEYAAERSAVSVDGHVSDLRGAIDTVFAAAKADGTPVVADERREPVAAGA